MLKTQHWPNKYEQLLPGGKGGKEEIVEEQNVYKIKRSFKRGSYIKLIHKFNFLIWCFCTKFLYHLSEVVS